MKEDILGAALAQYALDKDQQVLAQSVADYFGIPSVHPSVIPYLCGETERRGLYLVQDFKKCYDNHWSYAHTFDKLGNGLFPAVVIGGDGNGVEFWLMLETSKVIMLHHDATFYEEAGYIDTEDPAEFCREFEAVGSRFDLGQLLDLQARTKGLDERSDEFPKQLMVAAAASLGVSVRELAGQLGESPLEILVHHLGDLHEYEEDMEAFLDEVEPQD